jgi:hypothetical protein
MQQGGSDPATLIAVGVSFTAVGLGFLSCLGVARYCCGDAPLDPLSPCMSTTTLAAITLVGCGVVLLGIGTT